MANATVAAAGSATVQSAGGQTGQLLNTFNGLVAQAHNAVSYNGSYPTAAGIASLGAFTLAVAAASTSTVPSVIGNAGPLSGNGDTQVLLAAGAQSVTVAGFGNGVANAADGAVIDGATIGNLIDSFGNKDTINDTANAATIAAGGAGNTVFLGGNGQYLFTDSGATGTYTEVASLAGGGAGTVNGAGNIFVIGSYGTDQPTVQSAASVLQLTSSNFVQLLDPTAHAVLVLHGGTNTISAVAGVSTVFATTGTDAYSASGNAASIFFVGAVGSVVGVSTVAGGSGADTIYAEAGVNYIAGSGNDIFVGGSASVLGAADSLASTPYFHSTVNGTTGREVLFGGTIGDLYNVGGSADLIVNGGGADVIAGGSVAPTLFGNTGGYDQLLNTYAGAVLVANGNNDVINAAGASQGSKFFVSNVPSLGSATLVGSAGTPTAATFDQFVISSVAGANAAPHTITIDGFQTGDAVFLLGYTPVDNQTFAAAVAAHAAQGGNLALTLSDNTTIQFMGNHPTATFNGGIVAL